MIGANQSQNVAVHGFAMTQVPNPATQKTGKAERMNTLGARRETIANTKHKHVAGNAADSDKENTVCHSWRKHGFFLACDVIRYGS